MKLGYRIPGILLGAIFVFFGSNHLHQFLPSGPPQQGPAGEFNHAFMVTHYSFIVGICEVVGGILLLVNRFVPLALTILGPVIVNILLVGFLMSPMALPAGIVVALLWMVVFWQVRSAFAGIFQARVPARRPRP
jgi:peptidoglycan biosynthesis protein MviN/MurJ (putative lipid II flippase)